MGGHKVHAAAEAGEALDLLTKNEFDVVVTDILLPGMNGVELLKAIREAAPRVQVLMMTGQPTIETAAEALRAGAFDYLIKPITKEPILKAVAAAARVKALDDERIRLEEENLRYREHLEQMVEERTVALAKSRDQLARSQMQYLAALRSTPHGLCLLDTEWVIEFANHSMLGMARCAGDAPAALIGLSFQSFFPSPGEFSSFAEAASREFTRGGKSQKIRQLRRLDGSSFWCDISIVPCDPTQTHPGMVATLTDITERKQNEDRARAFASLGHILCAVASPLDAARIILNTAKNLIGWDSCWLMAFSQEDNRKIPIITIDTIAGKIVEEPDFSTGESASEMVQRILPERRARIVLNNSVETSSPFMAFGDQSRRSETLMFAPIRYLGELLGILSIQSYTPNAYEPEDLSTLQALADHCSGAFHRIQANEARKLTEAQLLNVMASLEDVVWSVDIHTKKYLYLSSAAETLYQTPREAFIANPHLWIEYIHPDDREFVVQSEQNILHTRTIDNEYRIVRANGEIRWIHGRAYLIHNSNDEPVRMDGIMTDITEHKQNENRRRAFAQLGERLSAASSLLEAAQTIADTADEIYHWDAFSFAIYHAETDTLNSILDFDLVEGKRQAVAPAYVQSKPSAMARRVLAEGPQILLREQAELKISADATPFGDKSRPSASIIRGLVRKGAQILGMFSVHSYQPHAYQPSDLDTLQALGDLCGGALDRLRAQEDLRLSEQRYALAARAANDGLWDWDMVLGHVYYSTRWKTMLGLSDETVGDGPNEWLQRIHPEDRDAVDAELKAHLAGGSEIFQNEHRLRHRQGSYIWVLCRGVAVRDESATPTRIAGGMIDITDRKMAEDQLLHGAFYDSLTDLPNRSLLLDRIGQCIARCRRHSTFSFAILFMDLDRFKTVNDSLGHITGDLLLKDFARRMEKVLRPVDTIARLGGDEFVILLEDVQEERDAIRVAQRVRDVLATPFAVNEMELNLTASIGIAAGSGRYARPEDIIRDADTALYAAKSLGRNRFTVFDETMHAHAVRTLILENDLRRAIERKQFVLYYQPIVSALRRKLCGFEALIRWNHPERGWIQPIEFIPLAEETGLIIPLGVWVLRTACQQLKQWQELQSGKSPLTMNINISARQFTQPQFIFDIEGILSETGLDPSSVKLEITESLLMENSKTVVPIFDRIRSLGVQLVIDDFGTGYSSLAYLHTYPLEGIKIDRSFILGLERSEREVNIVRTMITLAKNLQLSVTAEGVENLKQLQMLQELSCDTIQGYFFSKPVPPAEAEQWLDISSFPLP